MPLIPTLVLEHYRPVWFSGLSKALEALRANLVLTRGFSGVGGMAGMNTGNFPVVMGNSPYLGVALP